MRLRTHLSEFGITLCHLGTGTVFTLACQRLRFGGLHTLRLLCVFPRDRRLCGSVCRSDFMIPLRLCLTGDRIGLILRQSQPLAPFGLLATFLGLGVLFRNTHLAFAEGLSLADRAFTILLGDLHLGPIDRLCSRPLSNRLDIAALIGDVADVYVDQFEPDLVDLLRNILVDERHELLAILVDLLDRQGGNHQSQLAENDVLGLLANCVFLEHQETLGRIVHQHRIGGDANRKRTRHVDTDIVEREGALQWNLNDQWLQRKKLVGLNQGNH